MAAQTNLWEKETEQSLETTLRVLLRKYPSKTTPVMKDIYDELQKRKGEKAE